MRTQVSSSNKHQVVLSHIPSALPLPSTSVLLIYKTMTVVLRELPIFGRVATWEEWRAVTAETLPDFIVPWFICNMLGFILLWIAIKFPQISRKAWGLLMILACFVNSYVVLTDPKSYLEFGVLAIPTMQKFIYSKFFSYPALLVIPIAVYQLAIGIVLLLSESPSLIRVSLMGAMVFFFGITPLGLSSAFPSSLVYASTMMLCWPSSSTTTIHDKNKQKES